MKYLDDLETRSPEVRERALMRALADQIAHAKKHAARLAEPPIAQVRRHGGPDVC